jgi:hypothetical protein
MHKIFSSENIKERDHIINVSINVKEVGTHTMDNVQHSRTEEEAILFGALVYFTPHYVSHCCTNEIRAHYCALGHSCSSCIRVLLLFRLFLHQRNPR